MNTTYSRFLSGALARRHALRALCGAVVTIGMVGTGSALAQSGTSSSDGRASSRAPTEVPGARGGDLFEPLGLRRGSFLINPYLIIEAGHDDNVFLDNTDRESDNFFSFNPGVYARSLWSRHDLQLYGDVKTVRYSDLDSEDFDEWDIGAEGRIDVDRSRFITLGAEVGESQARRSDPDNPNLSAPTSVDYKELSAGWYQEFNRLYYRLGLRWNDEDYKPVTLGGQFFSNDDRDFDRTLLTGEVGYEFKSNYSGFVRLESESTNYALEQDDQGIDRDSDGFGVLAGVNIDIEDVLAGRVYVGHRDRDYEDATFNNISGGVIGAGLTWDLSRLTTLTLDADRSIRDATGEDVAGYIRTNLDLGAEHELFRNVVVTANLGLYEDDYDGIDRNDDGFSWSLGGQYLANRWLRIGAYYEHDERDSKGADTDASSSYDRDVFRLTVELIR